MRIRSLLPDVIRRGTDEDYPFYSLQREMNNLFDTFVKGIDVPRGFLGDGKFLPCVDVKETDDKFDIKAELPGVDEKDIEVTVTNDSVTIKGEKKQETGKRREREKLLLYGEVLRLLQQDDSSVHGSRVR